MSERDMKQAKFGFLYEPGSEGEVCLLLIYKEMSAFIEELKSTKCVEFILGKGDKIPTLGVCIKLGGGLSIEASGKAYMAYSNVNVKPPKPNLPEVKIAEIRKLLNEPKREWHYIKAQNLKDRISTLRQIVKIMVSE